MRQIANPGGERAVLGFSCRACARNARHSRRPAERRGHNLRGAWLTDGDSHGSYLEGHVDGARVQLSRRWRSGKLLHEQQYELTLDSDGQHLNGIFREPALAATAHSLQLERGFVSEPRRVEAAPPAPVLTLSNPEKPEPARDPKRPCDCALVCYCGGVPPGPEHYEEAARCGASCKCRVCPPIP